MKTELNRSPSFWEFLGIFAQWCFWVLVFYGFVAAWVAGRNIAPFRYLGF